jgi:hypothetical protein
LCVTNCAVKITAFPHDLQAIKNEMHGRRYFFGIQAGRNLETIHAVTESCERQQFFFLQIVIDQVDGGLTRNAASKLIFSSKIQANQP